MYRTIGVSKSESIEYQNCCRDEVEIVAPGDESVYGIRIGVPIGHCNRVTVYRAWRAYRSGTGQGP